MYVSATKSGTGTLALKQRSVTYILLSCIRKHGAVRERVKFAVYEMLQLNFRARLLLHRMPLAQRDESRSGQPNQTILSMELISQHSIKYIIISTARLQLHFRL